MRAANSAAQVSTVWYTGRIPNACRSSRTWSSGRPLSSPTWASENPARLAAHSAAVSSSGPGRAGAGTAGAGTWAVPASRPAISSIPWIWSTNQGSIPLTPATSSTVAPARSAWWTVDIRPSCGTAQRASSSPRSPGGWAQLNGAARSSSERRAFCSASGKFRPMAIASPTDFMCVVSSGSAPGNFSNANRGTLTTT